MDAGLFDDMIPQQVYGAGAPESGQQATPQQQAYAAAAARFRDPEAPAATPANPSYDTPSVQGAPGAYHVDTKGQLNDPNPQVSLGLFDDLLPGGAVHARTNELLGLEQGVAEPARRLWDRVNASPTLTQIADTAGDAFPELYALRHTTDRLSKTGMEDVNAKIAAGQIPGPGGRFVGNMIDTAPLPGGPITAGLLGGALLSDKDTPIGVGLDAAEGAVGGKLFHGALGAVSHMVNPKIAPHVSTLIGEGVPLTAGQIIGGPLRRVEDAFTSLPMAGDVIGNAKRRSLDGLNIAVANRALAPIGESVPASVSAGREAIAHAGDTLSDRYNAILPKLTIQPDAQFGQDMASLGQQAGVNLTDAHMKQLGRTIKTSIIDKIDPATGQIDPRAMQDAETTLGLKIGRYGKSPMPEDQNLSDALTSTREILRDLVARNNPQAAGELGALRTGWANLVIGENAAASLGAHEGVFTPSQLAGAVKKSDNSVRSRAYARGDALMQDLSDAALARLPSTVPDSGSPLRHLMEAGVAMGVAKESKMPVVGKASALAAILSAPYTEGGQKVTQALLAGDRPAIAPHIAAILDKIKPIARIAGTVAPSAMTRTNGYASQ